jgi:hypothetical protein
MKGIVRMMMFLALAMVGFASIAFAASTVGSPPSTVAVDWSKLLGDPAILGAVIAPAISSLFTMPITQFIKDYFKWDGKQAELLNGALNTLVLAVLPFIAGVYTFTLEGLLYAALMALLGFAADKGIWKTGKALSGADSPPIGAGQ